MVVTSEKIPSEFSAELYLQAITGAPKEDCLFFDIETTGLSASVSFVFLIGCVFYDRDEACFMLRQYLIRYVQEEEELLRAFFSFAQQYRILLHFNGQSFDLPFLAKRAQALGLFDPLPDLASLDLYQRYRPLKQLLGLSHMNQKSLEEFLQWQRRDVLDGEQVVSGYWDFSVSGKPDAGQPLLLHNHDDLLGLMRVTALESFRTLAEGRIKTLTRYTKPVPAEMPSKSAGEISEVPAAGEAESLKGRTAPATKQSKENSACADTARTGFCTAAEASDHRYLILHFRISLPLPLAGAWACAKDAPPDGEYLLTVRGSAAELRIPIFTGELLYFLPDYKNYYFLPLENQVIHKSLAAYVSKDCRVPAHPQTCFIPRKGRFLPQPEPFFSPSFRESYDSKSYYFEYSEGFLAETEDKKWEAYISLMLKQLCGS